LVTTVRNLYKRIPDARVLVPILTGLDKEEIISYLPKLVVLPPRLVQTFILRLIKDAPNPITPEQLLIALHQLDTTKDNHVPLKKAIDAIQICLEKREVYKQEVLAVVLQQLSDITPIPSLFVRTVIQAYGKFPKLVAFVITILSKLISKQVWADKRLWEGFIKCCKITHPHSNGVVLQLPRPQFEDLLQTVPELKEPLMQVARKNSSLIPRELQPILLPVISEKPVESITS